MLNCRVVCVCFFLFKGLTRGVDDVLLPAFKLGKSFIDEK